VSTTSRVTSLKPLSFANSNTFFIRAVPIPCPLAFSSTASESILRTSFFNFGRYVL